MPERVSVIGASGSGKSTLARALARRHGLDHVEFDAIHHMAGWRERPAAQTRAIADARCPVDGRWVTDGNYAERGGDLARERAQLIVWLDLPRPLIMARVLRRTVGRLVRRQSLWNGNRESFAAAFSMRPDRSIFRWAWTQHAELRRRWCDAEDERLVRLGSPAAVRAFLRAHA